MIIPGGGGVGTSFAPPFVFVIASNMKSVRSFQLLEFLALELSHILSIPSSEGSLRAAERASITYYFAGLNAMPFTLYMDDD